MYNYIPYYRSEQINTIYNIYKVNGYEVTKNFITTRYKTKDSRCRFISGYRKGFIKLTKGN
mgnify:FL=1|jgi:hypothetical protein